MTFKYITRSLSLLLGITVLASCLNNNQVITDPSTDAQLYGLTATAAYDSTRTLTNAKFSIDQLLSQVYNRDSLNFGFEPKNALLAVSVKSASGVKLYLQNPDSNYFWKQEDSVNIARLKYIEVYAQDEKTTKKYEFKLNIHQVDPYILVWDQRSTNYIPALSLDQKTVFYNNQFLTYYQTTTGIKAAASTDGETNTALAVTGLPSTGLQMKTVVSTNTGVYAMDAVGKIYKTTDGGAWSTVTSPYPVKAIYGTLPSPTTDSILTVVNDAGTLKFAKTKDLTAFRVLSPAPSDVPVAEFSAAGIKDPRVYSAKYIVISGGKTAADALNNKIWIIQEKGSAIAIYNQPVTILTQGSTLFPYDDKLYMLTSTDKKANILYISQNYGLNWKAADANQALPADFAYRTYAPVITDANNYIRIFGGTSGTQTQLTDVWRGRLNKLATN
ncbi:MAG: DUF6242 domain-containing protein [Petrimonas sp.]|nr:DUF6242 domain-containing protein [Petrimonas sp.]